MIAGTLDLADSEADGTAPFQHEDGQRIDFHDALDEVILGDREIERGAVDAGAFEDGVESGEDDGDIGIGGGLDALVIGVAGAHQNAVADGGGDGLERRERGNDGSSAIGTVLLDACVGADDGDGIDAAQIQGQELLKAEASGGGIIF